MVRLKRVAHRERVSFAVKRSLCMLVLVFLVALSMSQPVAAQNDVTFTASVDKTQLNTDAYLTLELVLTGPFRNAGKPNMPQLEDFYVMSSGQSSQFSLINGQMSSSIVYSYRLQPVRSGTLTIPSIAIEMAKETFRTEPVTVEVTAGSASAPQPDVTSSLDGTQAPAPQALTGQNFYVEAEVDNTTPYVSQQIVYIFRLYQRVNFSRQPNLDWPEFTGFLSYDLSPNNQYNQTIDGQQYLVTEVRRALFPTSSGKVNLDPAILTVPGDFFNQGLQMQTNPVTVDARNLPENAPEIFAGAVGLYGIQTWVEPEASKVNVPVSLFVRIQGTGNSYTLPDPTEGMLDAVSGWRAYEPQITTTMEQTGGNLHGEKLIERLLVPTTPGVLSIPAFSMAYFDPMTGLYQVIETPSFEVNVAEGDAEVPGAVFIGEGKQAIQVLGADIRHIKAAPPVLNMAQPSLLEQPIYWVGWIVPLCVVIGTFFLNQHRQALERDSVYTRQQRAYRSAHKRLRKVRNMDSKDVVYAAVTQSLTLYVSDKLALASAGLTRDAIRNALQNRVSPELVDRLLVCLDWADTGRFAPTKEGKPVMNLVTQALDLVEEMEKVLV